MKKLLCFYALLLLLSATRADLLVWLEQCEKYDGVVNTLPFEFQSTPPASCRHPFTTLTFESQVDEERAYRKLLDWPGVTSVERVQLARPALAPTDPDYSEQWHYQPESGIDMPDLWSQTHDCSGVVFIVMDSGIEDLQTGVKHPVELFEGDLGQRLLANPLTLDFSQVSSGLDYQEHGLNLHCSSSSDCYQDDYQGHGTHVAGIIAANWDNGRKVAGICSNAAIVPINFLGHKGGDTTDINASWLYVEALIEALPADTRFVWNNSWEIGPSLNTTIVEDLLSRYADRLLLVSAAGNSSVNLNTQERLPASLAQRYRNALTVANATAEGALHSTSNFGSNAVDLALPGTNILSLWLNDGNLGQTGISIQTGTSMAAPVAAGLAGLLWTRRPELTAAGVRAQLLAMVDLEGKWTGTTRYSGPIATRRLLEVDQSTPRVFRYLPEGSNYRIVGAYLDTTASVEHNGETLSFTLLAPDEMLVEHSGGALPGYLILKNTLGQAAAKLWTYHRIEPVTEVSADFTETSVTFSWSPSSNAESVRIEWLTADGYWDLWETAPNSPGVFQITRKNANQFAYRLVAYHASVASPDGGSTEAFGQPSDAFFDTSLFDIVRWESLELASLTTLAEDARLWAVAPEPVRYTIDDTVSGISIEGSRLKIRDSQASELGITAFVDGFGINPVRRTFSLKLSSDEFRRFGREGFANLRWPGETRSLQLVKPINAVQPFIYAEWPAAVDDEALVEFWAENSDRMVSVELWSDTDHNWVSMPSTSDRHFAQTVRDGGPFDLDSQTGWVSTRIAVETLAPPPASNDRRCFIASAVFSGTESSSVDSLRQFREAVLLNPRLGAFGPWLVEGYYDLSPYAVLWLERNPEWKAPIRWWLTGWAWVLRMVLDR